MEKSIRLADKGSLRMLIPEFMTKDRNFQGIIYALESELGLMATYFDLISMYANIDKLPEEILDELAWQFNIIEYDKSYNIEMKRDFVRDCMSIHHKRGTVAAVEEVCRKVFGNATVEEWFDYGGQPYHFKIRTENLQSTDEMVARVAEVVSKTQNVRSHLEAVIVEIMQSMNLYAGCSLMAILDTEELETVNIF